MTLATLVQLVLVQVLALWWVEAALVLVLQAHLPLGQTARPCGIP